MRALAAPWLLLPFLFLGPWEATGGTLADRGVSQHAVEAVHESPSRPISATSRTGDYSGFSPGAALALGADASPSPQARSPVPLAGLQGTPDPSPGPPDNGPVDEEEDDDGISTPLLIGIGLLIVVGLAAGWVLAGRRGLK